MKKGVWVVIMAFVLGGILGAILGIQMSGLNERIEKLETASTSLQGKVGSLETQVRRIGDLEGRLTEVEGTLEKLNVTTCVGLDELRAKLEDLDGAVTYLKASLDATAKRQNGISSKMDELSEALDAIKSGLEKKIADLRTEVNSKISGLSEEIDDLNGKVSDISSALLKVGYVDFEGIIDSIWQSQAEWAEVVDREKALEALKAQRDRGEITQEEYVPRANVLDVELLLAHHGVLMSVLEKLSASSLFENEKADLDALKGQMETLAGDLQALLENAKAGTLEPEAFASRSDTLSGQLGKLREALVKILSAKISEVASEVAREKGIGLVLRYNAGVIVYNAALVEDLSSSVKERLSSILGA